MASQPGGHSTKSGTGLDGHPRPSAGRSVGMEAEGGIVPREPMIVRGNKVSVRNPTFRQLTSLFRSW